MPEKMCPLLSIPAEVGVVECLEEKCMWYFAPDCAVSYVVSLVVRADEIAKRVEELGKRWSA